MDGVRPDRPDTYEDFVSWRACNKDAVISEAFGRFFATPHEVLLAWISASGVWPQTNVTEEKRLELCQRNDITIDGKPARITGYGNAFAHVVAAGGVCVEFAWETVRYVAEQRGGRFTS
jgi:hypothetical protein